MTGGIEQLADGVKQYSKFLRQLHCGGDVYPGDGPACQYNATHQGFCSADCIKGLEDSGEFCGCSGGKGEQCPASPVHVRCCLDTCSQDLKMDLGLVLDASGSIGYDNYQLQLVFTKDLLRRVNVGANETRVGIINFSDIYQVLTWLNTDYDLESKLQQVDKAEYYSGGTDTAAALQEANIVFSYEYGLRPPEEGATMVLFIVTDGQSDSPPDTIRAANVLKNKGITIVSVGVGEGPNLDELYAICTPPASENYFAISDYAALEHRIDQFTARSCAEPASVSTNTTVNGDVARDKYRFLKVEIEMIGNKILVTVRLFNGQVKLFYSFTSRNPKDPADFEDYQSNINTLSQSHGIKFTSFGGKMLKRVNADGDTVKLVIEKPDAGAEYFFLGVKGVEDDNTFEVNFDDCANVDCKSSSSAMKLSMMLLIICDILSFIFKN